MVYVGFMKFWAIYRILDFTRCHDYKSTYLRLYMGGTIPIIAELVLRGAFPLFQMEHLDDLAELNKKVITSMVAVYLICHKI